MIECRNEKIAARFFPDLAPFILHKPAERVDEDRNEKGGQEGKSEIDPGEDVDTGQVTGFLEIVITLMRYVRLLLHDLCWAVLGAAGGQDLVSDAEVCVKV